MQKIKVFHIITKLEMGGAQGNTIYTIKNLNKDIFSPILAFGKGGILDEEVLKENSYKKFLIKNLVREISPLKDFLAFIEIYKILKKEKPDILHSHSSKAGILARFAAYFAKVPNIIHTFHGFGFNKEQNFIIRNIYIFLEKISANFTDKLIFVSNENMNEAISLKIGKTKKYEIIRSGIKLSKYKNFKPDENIFKEFNINENDFIITSLGNLKPQKNPDDFYKIAKICLSRNNNFKFIYIGGGERLEEFKNKAIKDSLNERCFFTGFRNDSIDILSISNIFILTSLWEGLPRSLIEALSLNLIPICYKTDGVKEIIENEKTGFLIEKKDFKNMIEKIIYINKDKLIYSKIKENIKNLNLDEFDIDLMVKKQEEMYLSLIQ